MVFSSKVETLETRLVLVRENYVDWLDLVGFDVSSIVVLIARVSFGSAILFTNLESSARKRVYSDRPKIDTKVTNDTVPAKPLTVLEPQMSPASVPGEKIIFM